MLGRIEADQPLAVAVQHRAGGHHLGVDQRAARQQAMEEPAVPVGPFHHRRNAESAVEVGHIGSLSVSPALIRLLIPIVIFREGFRRFWIGFPLHSQHRQNIKTYKTETAQPPATANVLPVVGVFDLPGERRD